LKGLANRQTAIEHLEAKVCLKPRYLDKALFRSNVFSTNFTFAIPRFFYVLGTKCGLFLRNHKNTFYVVYKITVSPRAKHLKVLQTMTFSIDRGILRILLKYLDPKRRFLIAWPQNTTPSLPKCSAYIKFDQTCRKNINI
jgi:hypothetical protein